MAAISMAERRKRKAAARRTQPTVRSEVRALRLMEFLCSAGQGVTVMQVARALDFPQSSTSALLSRLVDSGFVCRDPWRRIYYPTARMAVIGLQLTPRLPCGDRVLDVMGHLADYSGGAVFLAGLNQFSVQTIHVVAPAGHAEAGNGVGAKYELVNCTPGRIILSTAPESQAYGHVRRHNAETRRANDRVNVREFLDGLKRVRTCGYALSSADSGLPQPLGSSLDGALAACLIPNQNRLSIALRASSWWDTLSLTVGCPRGADEAGEEDFARAIGGEVTRLMSATRSISYHLPSAPANASARLN